MRGQRPRGDAHRVVAHDAAPAEGVDPRRGRSGMTVQTHMVPSQGIDGNQHDAAYGIAVEQGRLSDGELGALWHRHGPARGVGHPKVHLERALPPGALEGDRSPAVGAGPGVEALLAEQAAVAPHADMEGEMNGRRTGGRQPEGQQAAARQEDA